VLLCHIACDIPCTSAANHFDIGTKTHASYADPDQHSAGGFKDAGILTTAYQTILDVKSTFPKIMRYDMLRNMSIWDESADS
jgi:hypothetical protein